MRHSCAALLAAAFLCQCAAAENRDHASADFPDQGIRRILVTTVTETAATVIWTTATAERDELVAWTRDRKLLRAMDERPARRHSATLKGLKPNAFYHYFIQGPSGKSYVSYFQTVEPLPGKPIFKMAVVADPQFDGVESSGGKYFARVVEDINARKPEFVIFPGDLVDNRNQEKKLPGFTRDVRGFSMAFRHFKRIADGLKMPYYVCAGNHEKLNPKGTREAYCKIFGLKKAYYATNLRSVRLITLDASPRGEQMAWLKAELKAHPDQDIFVQDHYPIAQDLFMFDMRGRHLAGLKKALETHPRVRVVYNGHKNTLCATVQNGILYVNCPRPPSAPCGYLMVRVYPTGIVQTFINTPGLGHLPVPVRWTRKKISPGVLRWDPAYRWGRQEMRNFSWRYGAPMTSTGVK